MMSVKPMLALVCGLLLWSCSAEPATLSDSGAPPAKNSATPVPSSTVSKDGDYPGKGKITKINLDLGSVEMDHEEITGVMPAMRMEFYVSDKKLLAGLSVGDRVDFTLQYKDRAEVLTAIKKTK